VTFSGSGGHGALARGPYHLNPEVLRPRLADISVMNPAFLEQLFRRMGEAGKLPQGTPLPQSMHPLVFQPFLGDRAFLL